MTVDYADKTVQLAREMKKLLVEKENLTFATNICQKRLDEIRLTELPEAMENAGFEKMTIADVGTVYIRADLFASIPAAVKEEAWAWLVDNGHGDLISSTINGSTFKAWCKEQIKAGEPLPDLFKVTPYTMAVITK